MKLIIVLLSFFSFSARANLNAQVITLNEKEASVEKIIKEIQKQTGFNTVYNSRLIKKAKKVTIVVTKASLKEVLQRVFSDQSISYEIANKTIILKPIKEGGAKIIEKQAPPIIETVNIRGRVTDSAGTPLLGASVQVKGKTTGTSTNANGAFSVNAEVGDFLEISSVGFITKEVKIISATENIVVVLEHQPQEIEKVVVTALGIKREERSLTYNVQEFSNKDITQNKDANFVNALTGKVAGIAINSSSAGIGGSTRVVMRGTKSVAGNNNALYVVDGIPIPNSRGVETKGAFAGVTSGEGIASFNPEDIESLSVLTGPSATALYGNQGANGVIVVTTKKGEVGKLKVSLSHSSDFFKPFVMPEFQNTYGQGDKSQMFSWGQKLETPSSYRPRDFFQTGNNIFNSVSISGGTEKSQTLFSAGTNNANGIIPNNTFNRYNFYLRQTSHLTDRLTVDFNSMYVKLNDKNMISQGQYHNPLVGIYLFPPGDDIEKYKVYQRYNANRKIYDQFWPYLDQGLQMENPYWISFAESQTNSSDRFMLSGVAKYEVFDWLDITGRVRTDQTSSLAESKLPAGTSGLFASEYGYYTTNKKVAKSTYIDLIAFVKKGITPDLKFSSNIGGSYQDDKIDGLGAGGNLIKLANFYSVQENTDNVPTQQYNHIQLQSAFATAEFEYKRWLFLNVTGRYEWPSQLPKGFATKTSYFYPSIGISSVLSDALNIPKNVLSFAKLRMSFAEVGNPPGFGLSNPTYSLQNIEFRPAPFENYKPERTKSYEIGLETKFLKNKLSLNITGYKSNTFNQLLSLMPGTGSAYTHYYYNAGNVENKGIEASLGYNKNFNEISWLSNVVFSLNRNKVIRLSEGIENPLTGELFEKDSIRNGTVGNDLYNILTAGGSMSDLYVTQALRYDNQGNLWINPVGGGIEKINIPAHYIGRTTPDYTIGWRNSVAWKNIELSFLADARIGGVGVSFTQAVMDAFGVSKQSADARDAGGVEIYGKAYPDVEHFYKTTGLATGGQTGLSMFYVYSATNVRLREASVGYTLPETIFGGRVRNVRLALTGRNLFMFYNKAPFDPESTSSTGTYYQGIDYFRQPSYRSYGFSVRAQF